MLCVLTNVCVRRFMICFKIEEQVGQESLLQIISVCHCRISKTGNNRQLSTCSVFHTYINMQAYIRMLCKIILVFIILTIPNNSSTRNTEENVETSNKNQRRNLAHH
jgi:hypothetical protein